MIRISSSRSRTQLTRSGDLSGVISSCSKNVTRNHWYAIGVDPITSISMTHLVWILAVGLVGTSFSALSSDAAPADALIAASPTQSAEDSAKITALVAKGYAAWNAGDIDDFLSVYWRSPLLVVIEEESVFSGYDEVKANLERMYPPGTNRGNLVLERLLMKILSPETATTVEWFNSTFPKTSIHGITSSTWRKFPEGWRIVQCQTAILEN
jgi:ketosteroid isomerase-like protein